MRDSPDERKTRNDELRVRDEDETITGNNYSLLTITESNRLQTLESQMEQDQAAFVRYGNALLEIRDSRLYRQTHSTFEDYCRQRWQMERNYANKLIRSAEVANNLGTIVPTPTHESQVRPLTSLEPEQQREVWKKAVDTAPDGKVTAVHVERVKTEAIKSWTAPVQSDESDQGSERTTFGYSGLSTPPTEEERIIRRFKIFVRNLSKEKQISQPEIRKYIAKSLPPVPPVSTEACDYPETDPNRKITFWVTGHEQSGFNKALSHRSADWEEHAIEFIKSLRSRNLSNNTQRRG